MSSKEWINEEQKKDTMPSINGQIPSRDGLGPNFNRSAVIQQNKSDINELEA